MPILALWQLYRLTMPWRRASLRRSAWPVVHGLRLVSTTDATFAERKLTDLLDFLAAEDPPALRSLRREFEFIAVRRMHSRPLMRHEAGLRLCVIDDRLLRRVHRDLLAAQLVGQALAQRLERRGLFRGPYAERAVRLVIATKLAAGLRYPYSAARLQAAGYGLEGSSVLPHPATDV